MVLKIFSVFDEKAETFSPPMFLKHNGEALRSFQQVVEDNTSMISKFPSDYKLYALGTFDDVAGMFEGVKTPEFLANASDFVEVKQKG